MSYDCVHNLVDKFLYTKVCNNIYIFVCLYVNDMLIISNNIKGIKQTKKKKQNLSYTFKMKD